MGAPEVTSLELPCHSGRSPGAAGGEQWGLMPGARPLARAGGSLGRARRQVLLLCGGTRGLPPGSPGPPAGQARGRRPARRPGRTPLLTGPAPFSPHGPGPALPLASKTVIQKSSHWWPAPGSTGLAGVGFYGQTCLAGTGPFLPEWGRRGRFREGRVSSPSTGVLLCEKKTTSAHPESG